MIDRAPDEDFLGEEVVLDLDAPYVCLGVLVAEQASYFILENADVHDMRDSNTTRDLYVLDSRRHGINVNRRRVNILKTHVVSLSKLSDVLV